ncbi:hypothetical protein K474DRAFT_1598157 [Panus rudis PR-1116 ss-1]|nr:hypothetical protein K474DRAFT_1598157 [Panus rudis PR-1116 ss-1]
MSPNQCSASGAADTDTTYHTSSRFLELPSREELFQLYRSFYSATSNSAVRHYTCAVCARKRMRSECEISFMPLSTLPNPHRLRPDFDGLGIHWESAAANAMELTNGLLLLRDACDFSRNQEDPTIAVCNQSLAGNVTTFEFNMDRIADMIDGRLMPQQPRVLAELISVTYVGLGKLPKSWLHSTFRVRRHHVGEALRWLKANNPYYEDICIENARLELLPEDDVPVEIWSLVREECREEVLEQERAGYIPTGEDGTRESSESADLTDNAARPNVIPMQYLGVIDTDLTEVSSHDMLLRGLVNLWREGKEGGYVVQHGRKPVSDFPALNATEGGPNNFWERAFPMLFPYGVGGPERRRPVALSLADHIRYLLEQNDHRFRKHPTFPFVACSILQRRQALLSARIQMRMKDFARDANIFSSLTVEDLRQAAEEEEQNQPISNFAVRMLKQRVYATASRVMGSDGSRFKLRTQIWSTSTYYGPLSIWLTINPDDLHDPIAQLFVGEDIDLDAFLKTAGPDKQKRARNIAADGFAAAKFFHFMIKTILETLIGVKVSQRRVKTKKGVFGYIRAYFGTVECQGRGTLHLHILLWLEDAPTPDEMRELLRQPEFREKLRMYIKANFRAHHPKIATEEAIKVMPTDPEVGYSRPPKPDSPNYWDEVDDLEMRVVHTKQMHVCGPGCRKLDRSGKAYCKRRAPWPLSDDDVVEENGNYLVKRTYPFQNTHIPAISINVRCNNDGKFLTNSPETDGITWYITGYATKKQGKSYNASALMAKALAYHRENDPYLFNLQESQRLLLFRCSNILNKQQELPIAMCMSYLMDWGDVYRSHQYVPLYWTPFHHTLLRAFPELAVSVSSRQ